MLLWSDEWLAAMNTAAQFAQQGHRREFDTVDILLGLLDTSPADYWASVGWDAGDTSRIRDLLLAVQRVEDEPEVERRFSVRRRRRRPGSPEHDRCVQTFLAASLDDMQQGRLKTPLPRGHLLVVALQPGSRAVSRLSSSGIDVDSVLARAYESLLAA